MHIFVLSRQCCKSVARFEFSGCGQNQFKEHILLVNRLKGDGLLSYCAHGKNKGTKVMNSVQVKACLISTIRTIMTDV